MHNLTMPSAADSYQPVQDFESKKLLTNFIRNPHKYDEYFEQYASGVVFRIGFGRWLETGREPEFLRIIDVGRTVERVASPGAYLVDSIPALQYLPAPLAPFKREAELLKNEQLSLFRKLQHDVKDNLKRGSQIQCFTRTFLDNQDTYRLSDDEGAYVVGTLFEAGSGTTAAAMMSFCLAMCHFPQWQVAMQHELDLHVGNRMPEFDDIPNLPTVRAVIKEVLRWRPVTAGGVPHQLVRDDTYKGFFFPKNTVFHANQWAIHRDPKLYPEPEMFRPDRWLDPEFPTYKEPLSRFPNLQNFSCFGFGRRICPGQNIAERSLHILTARISWAVTLSKKKDDLGNDLPLPFYDYTSGFNSQPKHFDFDLKLRTPERLDQISSAFDTAKANRSQGI